MIHFVNLKQTMMNQSHLFFQLFPRPATAGRGRSGASFAAWLNEEAVNLPLEELLKPLPSEVVQQVGDLAAVPLGLGKLVKKKREVQNGVET